MPTTSKGIWSPEGTKQVATSADLRTLAKTADAAIPDPYIYANIGSAGADVFALPAGIHGFLNNATANMINAPEAFPSTIEVIQPKGSSIKKIRVHPYARTYYYETTTKSAGTGEMMPWIRVDPGSSGGLDAGTKHEIRKEVATRRKGGVIGTGGAAVVALRFDHGLGNFRDHVLPELRRLALPSTMAMNSGRWSLAENGGATASDLNTWAVQHGVEVWNHGKTHGDAVGTAAQQTEIAEGATELRSQLSDCPVDGFIIPGVGGTNYDGFNGGASVTGWDTTAGQIILANHGFSTGHMPGIYRRIDGQPRIGLIHRTVDDFTTASEATTLVDTAIARGAALTLMLHPSQLTISGKITPAIYTAILEYIAAKRDAGELMVLTIGGSLVADIRTPDRLDLAPPMQSPAAITAGSNSGRVANLDGLEYVRGGQVEITADVQVTSGSSTVSIAVDGISGSTSQSITGRKTIRRFTSIPMTATAVTARVNSSTAATLHQLQVRPV